MELTGGIGIGRICECSGVSQMVNSCFSYLRKGGRTVLIGLPKQPLHVENVLQDIGKFLFRTSLHFLYPINSCPLRDAPYTVLQNTIFFSITSMVKATRMDG